MDVLTPHSLDEALRLAGDLGYPVILKPDEGVGASGTHRVDSAETKIPARLRSDILRAHHTGERGLRLPLPRRNCTHAGP